MKSLSRTLMLFLIISLTSNLAWTADNSNDGQDQNYIIGPGDVLEVSVWKEESLTKQVIVLPDGNISFPLVGDITAGGKTLTELKSEIKTKIHRFVPDPELCVSVVNVNSMNIYVIGKVNNPGRFVINDNINVLQALAIAGGLNPFAEENNIKIFRQKCNNTTIFNFKYKEVCKGKKLEQNI
ncbi:MAG: polysaccharide biosynthesis/export family protein, partial [Bacteroidales bacterium]